MTNTHFIFFSPLSHSRIREWLFFVFNCIAAENKALRAYCDKEGLTYRQDRMQAYGYSDSNRKKKPVILVKTVDKSGESGIMKANKTIRKAVEIPEECEYILKAETNFWEANRMAQMNKCSVCENFDFKNAMCSIYNKDIPNDIFLELQACEYYKAEEQNPNDYLPVAKGR